MTASYRLLRAMIREALLREKIRSVKRGSPWGSKFDLRAFKELEGLHQMLAYADSFLDKLGEGSSRAAFVLTPTRALKVALNRKGIAQNEAEVDVATEPEVADVLARARDVDPQFRWVVVDLVRELTPAEFRTATGVDPDDFRDEVLRADKDRSFVPSDPFTTGAVALMRAARLIPGDVAAVEHWGKASDGRVVLLDYGATEDVWAAHYSSGGRPPADDRPTGR